MNRSGLGLELGLCLGLGALACVARPVGEDRVSGSESSDTSPGSAATSETGISGSEDGDPSATETTTESTAETGAATETDSGWDDCEEPVKLDLPSDGEPEPPDACTIEPIAWPTPEEWPGCELCEFESGCGYNAYLACRTPPEGTSCADICVASDCFGSYWTACDGDGPDDVPVDVCGIYEIDGRCCSVGKFGSFCTE